MTKLIDAEAAKAAILELTSRADDLPLLDVTPEIGHLKAAVVKVTVTKILATIDALPDASISSSPAPGSDAAASSTAPPPAR